MRDNEIQKIIRMVEQGSAGFNYDPTMPKNMNGNAVQNYAQLGYAQFDLTITNTDTANSRKVDLFAPNRSSIDNINPAVGSAYTTSIDYTTGNVILNFGVGQDVIISCQQFPYINFLRSLVTTPQMVGFFRYNVTTQAQIAKQIILATYSMFGANLDNTISPLSYKTPNQFQNDIIDIMTSFAIDGNKGMILDLLPDEAVTLNMFISDFDRVAAS